MPGVKIGVAMEKGKLTAAGMDTVEFMISTNKGEGMKPMSKIASGGELSRIMLALKNVIAEKDDIHTLIFDEIDTGVTVRGNKWFDHSKREGGYAVSFVQRYYRLPYQEAVLLLLGRKNGKSYEQAKPAKEAPKPFALPEPYGTMRRMYAYLMRQRHIDREVISYFVHEKLLYEDKHHNCVFVGLDGSGEAKHAHIRSTNSEGRVFRMNIESSASEHCFHKDGTDKSLYVFEAPIDLLSHITLYPYGWQEHSYVACCGTSIQPVLERLRQNPKLDTVYLCLDNDDAGNDASDRMMDTLEDMGLEVQRLCPVRKDWNDDLCAKFERKENQP